MTRQLSHTAETARRLEPERFLCALFAPEECRDALFALLAFAGETARIRHLVSEPMVGVIRLQWWRDAVQRVHEGGAAPGGHPVVQSLAEAIRRYRLPGAPFAALIEARQAELEGSEPAERAARLAHAEAVSGGLHALMADVLGTPDTASDERAAAEVAVRHVGIAWGLVEDLRARPAGDPESVQAIAHAALSQLAEARARRPGIPRRYLPALLPARLVDAYLGALARAGNDPTHRRVAGRRVRCQIGLYLSALRGAY